MLKYLLNIGYDAIKAKCLIPLNSKLRALLIIGKEQSLCPKGTLKPAHVSRTLTLLPAIATASQTPC
jgi:hypothetical protein